MHTDFNPLAVQECRAINNSNQTISTRRKERWGFRVFVRMEEAVEFEPTDSVVFMLNTIANNIAQRNANYPTTPQNVSISISSFTNRPVNPFSQAFFNLFMIFKTFTFDSFVFPLRSFWRQKHVTRSEAESQISMGFSQAMWPYLSKK